MDTPRFCYKCKIHKSVDLFKKLNKNNTDLNKFCRECLTKTIPTHEDENVKYCKRCKTFKNNELFIGNNDKVCVFCKNCRFKMANGRQSSKDKNKRIEELKNLKKRCNICHRTKNGINFWSKRSNKETVNCSDCINRMYNTSNMTVKHYSVDFSKLICQLEHHIYKPCRFCKKIYSLIYFKSNKKLINNRVYTSNCLKCRIRSIKNSDPKKKRKVEHEKALYLVQLKIERGSTCIDCGITDWRLLEFDHRDPSQKVSSVRKAGNKKKMKEESEKCDLRCRYCHKIKSLKQNRTVNKPLQRTKRIAIEYCNKRKIEIGNCLDCGRFDKNNLNCYDFDHIDPKTKTKSIADLVNLGKNIDIIEKEIQKCRLLCCNCHCLRTRIQLGFIETKYEVC